MRAFADILQGVIGLVGGERRRCDRIGLVVAAKAVCGRGDVLPRADQAGLHRQADAGEELFVQLLVVALLLGRKQVDVVGRKDVGVAAGCNLCGLQVGVWPASMVTSRPGESVEVALVEVPWLVLSVAEPKPMPIEAEPLPDDTWMPKPERFFCSKENASSAPGVTLTSRAALNKSLLRPRPKSRRR